MNKPTDIVLYRSNDGAVQLDVQMEQETVWLSQAQLAELFQTDRSVITKHLRNTFNSKELKKDQVCAKFAHTAADGKTYQTQFYNLDAILSVGYRVNSKRGTEFRIWATNVLKQHLIQGYSVNKKRLKALGQTLRIAADISRRKLLTGDEASALLQTISEYSYALDLLDDYDLVYSQEGQKRIADNALVAMTLMIAESKPKEKDVITAMLTNLIAGK